MSVDSAHKQTFHPVHEVEAPMVVLYADPADHPAQTLRDQAGRFDDVGEIVETRLALEAIGIHDAGGAV